MALAERNQRISKVKLVTTTADPEIEKAKREKVRGLGRDFVGNINKISLIRQRKKESKRHMVKRQQRTKSCANSDSMRPIWNKQANTTNLLHNLCVANASVERILHIAS
jgi:hypothetical protein